jgi:tetratricopeptide (TPR) repeat protein
MGEKNILFFNSNIQYQMYYHQYTSGKYVMEFYGNEYGQETVVVNGLKVSKQFSFMGNTHRFKVFDNGEDVLYSFIARFRDDGKLILRIYRNRKYIERIAVGSGAKPKSLSSKAKKEGLKKLHAYEFEFAVKLLEEAAEFDEKDSEVFLHLACAYSLLEQTAEAFNALSQALQKGYPHVNAILTHEMLAFLRVHDDFEAFWQEHVGTEQANRDE